MDKDTGHQFDPEIPDWDEGETDSHSQTLTPNKGDMATLITIATIGILGNSSAIIIIVVVKDLRRASNAFVCHHCVLDLVKSFYCLPFAQTLGRIQPILLCNVLGSSYIVFVTTTAFNLLALVMNEAYMFSDLTLGIGDSRNFCCVTFGIFIIWFGSIIMNLGVAFIPGNPGQAGKKEDFCGFVYGITRNYILHILWIVLVSLAISLTLMYLKKLHTDVKKASYYRLTTLIRATVQIDTDIQTTSQQKEHEIRERRHIGFLQALTRRKLVMLAIVVACFIVFWYPMFLLTVIGDRSKVPAEAYKALTFFAWSNPAISPFFFLLYLKMTYVCKETPANSNLIGDGRETPGVTDVLGELCHPRNNSVS